MLFIWILSVSLSSFCHASGELDPKCNYDCACCKDQECGPNFGWPNACIFGCIDGHRGARCYELCKYKNCKRCGFNDENRTCSDCYDGYYLGRNRDCTSSCPFNCKSCTSSTSCSVCKEGFYDENGSTTCPYKHCPTNCKCKPGQGDCVSCKQGFYDTSMSCNHECPDNCLTCESKESCMDCNNGFYNGYEYDNNIKLQLNNCSYACRDTCTHCQSYNNCLHCIQGKYGKTCQDTCSVGCKNATCLINSGHCECTTDFTGNTCMLCVNGKYGTICNQTCPKYCKGNICQRISAGCTNGCLNDYIIGTTCNMCKVGMHGELCDTMCPKNCKNSKCERYSGRCSYGCITNFNGTKCDICIDGKYGEYCEQDCPVHCAGHICKKDSGTCYDCIENVQGEKCDKCKSGYYGSSCQESCPRYCANNTCARDTGNCIHGCTTGFSGDRCCVLSQNCVECFTDKECKTCVSGYFRNSCNETCPGGCRGTCDISTGVCIHEGKTGEQSTVVGLVVGVVAPVVVVVVVFVVLAVLRRKMQQDSSNESNVNCFLSSNSSGKHKTTVREGHVYENIRNKRDTGDNIEDIVLEESKDNKEDEETEFYNSDSANMNVKVENLLSYVTEHHTDCFVNEFKNLFKPDNLSTLCKLSKQTENIVFNRYNGIYPFDHSRVTIPGEPTFFINASYIDGYHINKAYIASSGPTSKHTDNFKTFWRMVWHEKSDIIVMLTNLHEVTGMKCEQYWPDEDTEECYGLVTVKCRSVEVFAEYIVRSFTVSKGNEERNLTQTHFTAWPDKGVPSEVTSLVEFRQRVHAAPVVLGGPVIVHCSAGVGRTGTYIALDILTKQGKADRLVDVFNCVQKLRRQRVNMVQTAEQYIFLHKALVHTLTFGCEAQTDEEIHCMDFDADDTFKNMFKTLSQVVDNGREDDVAAREEIKRKHADKTRRHSDIPGNSGRVHLYLPREAGIHDYINATFINSFKIKNLFIAAQTPLSDTVEDFLCMIYQQNSCCVVALEDPLQQPKKYDVGRYLPADNETYTYGNFTVTSSRCESKPQFTVKKITIKHSKKGEEKMAYHFQYTEWGNGQKVADSPLNFVQFIKDVEKYVKEQVTDMPNVVVHCLNGFERSGLFCVVYTLLEKMEAERQVSVVNVIRNVRSQRKLSITSVEQLKFCYQCISAYLDSYQTYSNFATCVRQTDQKNLSERH